MEGKGGLVRDIWGSLILPSIVPRDLAFKMTALAYKLLSGAAVGK